MPIWHRCLGRDSRDQNTEHVWYLDHNNIRLMVKTNNCVLNNCVIVVLFEWLKCVQLPKGSKFEWLSKCRHFDQILDAKNIRKPNYDLIGFSMNTGFGPSIFVSPLCHKNVDIVNAQSRF